MKAIIMLLLVAGFAACKNDQPVPQKTGATLPALPPVQGGSISGQVTIADELSAEVSPGDAVFVMARNAATGSLIAVARLSAPDFPASFELTGNAAMHNRTALAGKVRLEVRLDKDGDAMTREPGDIVGQIDELVAVPATAVVLTLNEKL